MRDCGRAYIGWTAGFEGSRARGMVRLRGAIGHCSSLVEIVRVLCPSKGKRGEERREKLGPLIRPDWA